MVATSRLDRWLAPRYAARAGDTRREIADDPTEVTWWREGVQIGTLTVRAVARGGFAARRGDGSEGLVAGVLIVAEAGTALRAEDRLVAAGGVAYRLTGVAPDQRWRVEAAAEVVSR